MLAVVTGFGGLVYEVAWQRVLATLLGSHSEATAAVLAIFLGGLAAGYRLFGEASRRWSARAAGSGRPARLLLRYGAIEAAIGAWALAFPALFAGARGLSGLLPHEVGAAGFVFDVLLSALLIGPPSVLMGGTIPLLTQALARGLADATRLHALVYAANTAGAFAGALAAGFWLVPALGLVGVLRLAAALNLAAGAGYALIDRAQLRAHAARAATPAAESPAAADAQPARGSPTPLLAAGFLQGFAMMAVQAVLIRIGALAFGSSTYTFSMVVAVFVLCIALGSLAISALPRVPAALLPASLWALLGLLSLLYLGLDASPWAAHVLRTLFRSDPLAFMPFQISAFVALLLALGAPIALSGATLPLLFHRLRGRAGELGDAAGRLYGWNTLGSLAGALLGGYALLFWLDLHHVYRIALAALAGAAALATPRPRAGWARALAPAAGLAAALGIAALPAWSPERLSSGLFRSRQATEYSYLGPSELFAHHVRGKVRFYDDDPIASVALIEPSPGALAVVTNGKPDSAVPADVTTTCLAALIPAVLSARAERAFAIGYATGVTAGELAALRGMREVVVAEISPAIADAAPHFDFANQAASKSPKLQIVAGDAYRTLQRSEGSFDLIVSEPSNPWVAGVEMLYSREFLEAARARLAPGGVHAQWFHTYESDPASLETILRTYDSVFEHSAVWYKLGLDLLLVGMPDPSTALDLRHIARRLARPDIAAGLRRCGVRDVPSFLAHELLPMGVLHAMPLGAPLHTLLHPRLSALAGRAFWVGAQAELPSSAGPESAAIGARNSLVRRWRALRGGQLPEAERIQIVRETCMHRPNECVALLAEWAHEVPVSEAREQMIRRIQANPLLSRLVPLAQLDTLALLEGSGPAEGPLPVKTAKRAGELFASHYHHAAPYSRAALERVWELCEADPAQADRCVQARAELETKPHSAGGRT
jgi:spermidine synthase